MIINPISDMKQLEFKFKEVNLLTKKLNKIIHLEMSEKSAKCVQYFSLKSLMYTP